MAWLGIEGHDDVAERLGRALARGRLASTFLFVGPAGIGKHLFALRLAQTLLCQERAEADMAPCGVCPSCQQVLAESHPDLLEISKPPDKSFIPLAMFIGPEERRMREGLCHDISLKPFMGGRKIAIIDDADDLNEESANALLKTLEEPPPQSVLILIGTSVDKQLPTIRSRCQTVRFRPLEPDILARLILAQEIVAEPVEAARLAQFSDGSLLRASELADPGLWAFRAQLLGYLAKPVIDSVGLSKPLVEFVDAAGKEASARRARARQVIGFAVEYYRQVVRALHGQTPSGDADLLRFIHQTASAWDLDSDAAVDSLDRCLEALGHLDRNANQGTLLECWVDDLARLRAGGYVMPS